MNMFDYSARSLEAGTAYWAARSNLAGLTISAYGCADLGARSTGTRQS